MTTTCLGRPARAVVGGELARSFRVEASRRIQNAIDSTIVGDSAGSRLVEHVELGVAGQIVCDVAFAGEGMERGPSSTLMANIDDAQAYEDFDLERAFGSLWGMMADLFIPAATGGLHVSWMFEADPWLMARNQGNLLIAMSPRSDPSQAASTSEADPYSNDIGVIAYPLRPWRALEMLEAGYSTQDAIRATFMLAVVEAWGHECFEMYQHEAGIPVFDPHQRDDLECRVLLAGGLWQTLDICR